MTTSVCPIIWAHWWEVWRSWLCCRDEDNEALGDGGSGPGGVSLGLQEETGQHRLLEGADSGLGWRVRRYSPVSSIRVLSQARVEFLILFVLFWKIEGSLGPWGLVSAPSQWREAPPRPSSLPQA